MDLIPGVVSATGTGSASGSLAIGAYAIPLTVLNQDYDTGFRPGKNDWEFSLAAVALIDSSRTLTRQAGPQSRTPIML